MRIQFLMTLIFTFSLSPAFGKDSCTHLFELTKAQSRFPTYTAKEIFEVWKREYSEEPIRLPSIVEESIEYAQVLLREQGVEFVVKDAGIESFISITPSEATPLNHFAKMILKNYAAEVAFQPSGLFALPATLYVTRGKLSVDGVEQKVNLLAIGWRHVMKASRIRFLRDTELLHEMRHLKMHKDMLLKIHNALYGDVVIKGLIPGEARYRVVYYDTYLSFSELKTFHSMIKEDLTLLRQFIRQDVPPHLINQAFQKIREAVRILYIISQRIILINIAVEKGLIENKVTVELARDEGLIVASIEYFESPETNFRVDLPLTHAERLNGQDNHMIIARQLLWLADTARVTERQAIQAFEQLKDFYANTP